MMCRRTSAAAAFATILALLGGCRSSSQSSAVAADTVAAEQQMSHRNALWYSSLDTLFGSESLVVDTADIVVFTPDSATVVVRARGIRAGRTVATGKRSSVAVLSCDTASATVNASHNSATKASHVKMPDSGANAAFVLVLIVGVAILALATRLLPMLRK